MDGKTREMDNPDSRDDLKEADRRDEASADQDRKIGYHRKAVTGIVHEMKNQLGCVALFDELLAGPSSERGIQTLCSTHRTGPCNASSILVDLIVKYGP